MSARRILERAMKRHKGLDNNNNNDNDDDEKKGYKAMFSREEQRALERGVYVQVSHVLCQK